MTPKQMEQAVRVCLEWVAHDDLDTLRNDVLKAKAILKEIEKAPDEPKNPTCRECNNIEKIPSAFPNYRCKVRWYGVTPDERRNMLCSSFEPIVPAEPLEKQLAEPLEKQLAEALARAEKAERERDKLDTTLHQTLALRNDVVAQLDATNEWLAQEKENTDRAITRARKAEGERETWYANHSTARQRLYESVARAEKAESELKKATDKVHRMDDEFGQAFDRADKAEWVRNTAQFARNEAVARAEKAEKQRDKLNTVLSETLALGNDAVAEADATNDRSQKQIKKLNSDHDAALKRAEKAEKYLAIVQDAIRRIPS